MPDRLSELIRQRALVSDHLAWLDREIAELRKPAGEPAVTSPLPHRPPPVESVAAPTNIVIPSGSMAATPVPDPATPESEIILDQYRVTPATVKEDVRKGCLLYFVGAFVLLGVIVAILYFAIGTR